MKRPRALVLHGGWGGHEPERTAAITRELLGDFEVELATELEALSLPLLSTFDLLVPIWTHGELAAPQEEALLSAVAEGLGLLAWHGAASAFLGSRPYKLLLGGQFVAHPGGAGVHYTVQFRRDVSLVAVFLDELAVDSEQYYLLVDPAVEVLASTSIVSEEMPWLRGVRMPVAWKRSWGRGMVFYCALGHSPELLRQHTVATLLRRAAHLVQRGNASRTLSDEPAG